MSSSSDKMTMAAGICSFIPYILFIPISIYSNIRLYKHRNELFIQKRNIYITMGLNYAFIFGMFASFLAHLSILYLDPISVTISFSIFFLAFWTLLFFLNTKNWMIYYHEKWTYYALDLKWQQIINDKVIKDSSTESNWFITNRHKYGNRQYIFKLFGILHLFGLTLLITAQAILQTSNGHPNAITFSIVMIIITIIPYIIFYVFLTFKTPRFNDIFNIHWESQMHARLIVIMGIGLITFNMWYAIDFRKHIDIIWAMLCFPFVAIILFAMNMASTLLIIKKTDTMNQNNPLALMHTHIRQPTPSSTQRGSKNATGHFIKQPSMSNGKRLSGRPRITATSSKQAYTLDLILSHQDAFHLFMVHLSKELCSFLHVTYTYLNIF